MLGNGNSHNISAPHTPSNSPVRRLNDSNSTSTPTEPVIVWSPSARLTPEEVRQLDIVCRELLRAGRISQVFNTVVYGDNCVLLLNRCVSYADLRALIGHVRYKLTQNGTVETQPGPIHAFGDTAEMLSRPWVIRAATQWMLALLPLIAVVLTQR